MELYIKRLKENKELKKTIDEKDALIRELVEVLKQSVFFNKDLNQGKKIPMPLEICINKAEILIEKAKGVEGNE